MVYFGTCNGNFCTVTTQPPSCGHCVNHATEALKEIGAKDVDVSLEKKLAIAEISEEITDEVIKAAIDEVGYEVVKIEKA